MDAATAEIDQMNKELGDGLKDSQFKRRTLYRTIFSVVEAYVNHTKEVVHHFCCNTASFTNPEKLALLDRVYVVNDQGRIEEKDITSSMQTNVRMAFWAIAKGMGNDHVVDFGTEGARSFFEAAKVRDRITHPRLKRGWEVADDEIALLNKAWDWFSEQMGICSKPSGAIDLSAY